MSKQTTRGERKRRPSRDADAEAAGHRHERLSRILREEIAAVLRDDLADPRLEAVRITVVELSVDYKNARVSFVGGAADAPRPERERFERLLERATPFVRARLADAVDLKQVPALRFAWDPYASISEGE